MTQSTPWSDRHQGKDILRQKIWDRLKTHQAALGEPWGHIPNFVGAEQAALNLAQLPQWQQAEVIKCNPDQPQAPVRQQALAAGKCLYMAVPRLTEAHCFVALTRETLDKKGISLAEGATKAQILTHGTPVRFDAMRAIDLVVVGCVAVTSSGGRTGKGAGFADLELALLQEHQLISAQTTIVTTVHDLQVVPSEQLPMQPHDWPLDWIATPTQVFATPTPYARPQGINLQQLQKDQRQQIPALRAYLDPTPLDKTSTA
ncbi:MAG: 5-formyltetrahydrofolate cyclo-ligase [Leptolyngbyaceae cyanobacterium]